MNFLNYLRGKKDRPVTSPADFWNWFQRNEKKFYSIIKTRQNIEKGFFDKIAPKLRELREGIFYLTGMYDNKTVELILTADGDIKNIFFIEQLVGQAPQIDGWKFTALKPSLNIENVSIELDGLKFNASNLFFYSKELPNYPDEIDISIIHPDLNDGNRREIINGIYIFLDNYLGELGFVNNIDNLAILSKTEAQKELIPISKLKDFLSWRQKEFIEKYEGARYHTKNDDYLLLEAELESGKMLIAIVNAKLLNWDRQASHPWISIMTITYDGSENNGMPDNDDYKRMNDIEEEIMKHLIDQEGYLNVGRQTSNNKREIYFASKEFRKPSQVFDEIQKKYSLQFEIEYRIFKDKYWQTFERFKQL